MDDGFNSNRASLHEIMQAIYRALTHTNDLNQ
jgi:hypothetical protein